MTRIRIALRLARFYRQCGMSRREALARGWRKAK